MAMFLVTAVHLPCKIDGATSDDLGDSVIFRLARSEQIGHSALGVMSRERLGVVGGLSICCRSTKSTMKGVALAWLLAKSPVMLPIPGTSSVAHVEENIAAAEIELTVEQLARLDGLAS
nr:aldo/keto reductase [Ferrimicrobium sp.]